MCLGSRKSDSGAFSAAKVVIFFDSAKSWLKIGHKNHRKSHFLMRLPTIVFN